MRSRSTIVAAAAFAALISALPLQASAQTVQRAYANNPGGPNSFNSNELVESGHQFFGSASRGLALAVQEATRRWGEPNGYILGQEASGAFFGGLRYGEGKLFTRNAGERKVFWQGPSLGFDVGGDGARTMMLVYNMPFTDALYKRFVGLDGSAYFIGGFGVTAVAADEMIVVPIRAGVGARLGVNVGYLKFTPEPTWNPF
ncbi:DUF1134 domain-containing protein [Microvirga mediterraneensis]|uniref:DUF1134 domain-containing protein n=1 Tax=Microvirga mediterraneensis TaxID=2754695 RepID=A0A838BU34_9HYPH|nr:DUF1134 domain-containing protein [Microvirga mediterraneensis]MBA1158582.1 DUF1134 domain-containing protein [Microvirga mediterraneensis]